MYIPVLALVLIAVWGTIVVVVVADVVTRRIEQRLETLQGGVGHILATLQDIADKLHVD